MKPVRIRAQGFSTYRSMVDVDLTDVHFFSLSGPTGAGKSSLIDAMVFALYGRVPRLGSKSAASAISAGSDWARVAFDFEVDGDLYSVVRRVERTSSGASLKEVRLQMGDKVIAEAKADDVLIAIEGLLNLSFDDFIKTVVLPQGEFARFLSATRSERQALLKQLLGLDIYTEVRTLARTRESSAATRTEVAQAQFDALQPPNEVMAKKARSRMAVLEKLSTSIVEDEKRIVSLETASELLQAASAAHAKGIEDLRSLSPPDQLEALDQMATAAEAGVEDATKATAIEAKRLKTAEEALSSLPSTEMLERQAANHGSVERLNSEIAALKLDEVSSAFERSATAVASKRSELEEIEGRLRQSETSHAAHSLTAGLVVGEGCPVCDQKVEMIPQRAPVSELESAVSARDEAVAGLRALETVASEAKSNLAATKATMSALGSQLADLKASLTDAPGPEEIAKLLAKCEALAAERALAQESFAAAQQAEDFARSEWERLSEAVRTIGLDLMAARQAVAHLDPPLPRSDDPIVQWKELIAWRDGAIVDREKRLATTLAEGEEAALTLAKAREDLEHSLTTAGVEPVAPYAVEVTRSLEQSRAVVDDHRAAVAASKHLGEVISTSDAEAKVAAALANHLKANGFEQWLMAGAIADLVEGANGLLGELSGGGYSLRSDHSGDFSIVDHHNANEIRAVSTLSGGETFLVSLALALSLAETLTSAGGSSLDAIILDEGFGTLDEESLDVVASVLEELSGEGFMVGVITHVKELAARAPVRFEVTKAPGDASVRRVAS